MNKEGLIEAYIGVEKTSKKSLDWYKDSFKKSELSGGLSWKWSWWAFFGNWLFLLYRKCYLEGISYFVLINIIGKAISKFEPSLDKYVGAAFIFLGLLSGGLLHNLLYRRYIKIRRNLELKFKSQKKVEEELKKAGGGDWRAVIIGVIGYFIVNLIFNL